MKVKNNKHQKMKMLERRNNINKNNKKPDQPRFTEKEIDEFRKKNGLPRLSKPVKAKNKAKNNMNMKNNVKVMFKENDDYGEAEEIKVSFDSVNLKTKNKKVDKLLENVKTKNKKNKTEIYKMPQTGTDSLIKNLKTKNKKNNANEVGKNSKIDNGKPKKHEKIDNSLFKVEKKVKKISKKRNKRNKDNNIVSNGTQNASGNKTVDVPNMNQVILNDLPKSNVPLESSGVINKLQQKMLQSYQDKEKTTSLKGVIKNKKKDKLRKLLEKAASSLKPVNSSGNKLRDRMMEKLKAAQFRYLNERLYTSSGSEAQQLFTSDPAAFTTYHQGYRLQVSKWPLNPLDVIVKKILKMPKSHIIADMGCGEATLCTRVPQTVHSLDLVSTSPHVTACDMAHTPLQTQSVDVTVYCLSLMGTQLTKYLKEANRVLKIGGRLLIAEVESRFDDVNVFIRDVERLGFKLKQLDQQHQVFFFIDFEKVRDAPAKTNKLPDITLKPCLYKKR